MKKRDERYYREREQKELERAVRATHPATQFAHIALADLYRRELNRFVAMQDRSTEEENPESCEQTGLTVYGPDTSD
jgi:hypothetical protein